MLTKEQEECLFSIIDDLEMSIQYIRYAVAGNNTCRKGIAEAVFTNDFGSGYFGALISCKFLRILKEISRVAKES